jgi:uncharacterized protein
VRLHEVPGARWLRIEAAADELARVLELRDEVQRTARERGYAWVTLDLAGYRTGGGTARPA